MGTLDMDVDRPASKRPTAAHKHDELLSMPGELPQQAGTIPRAACEYVNKDEAFLIRKRSFERQYAQLYFSRLMLLQPVMERRVAAEWPNLRVAKILSVGEEDEVAVIGTLYKDMRLKPSILDEYGKEPGLKAALGGASCFCADDDGLVLEDEGARMTLRSECDALKPDAVVTGIVVAVRGRAEPGGDFVVSGVLWPGLPPQPERPLAPAAAAAAAATAGSAAAAGDDRYVALVSGLQLADARVDMMQVELLTDFLTGNLGSPPEQALAAAVVQLVVAGGSLGALEVLGAPNPYSRQQTTAMEPVRDMDMIMTELAAALPVDMMPGPDDPANVSLPQQPLHQCLFPGAAPYSSFRRVPNPHCCALDGAVLLGTSGQNIDDMAKYTRGQSRLDLLEACLTWSHLAPTAPDSLACYPFGDDDPFVLRECPHVLFAGNQPAFDTRLVQGPAGQQVRLVCVPSFLSSGSVVLVNLASLECRQLTFQSIFA